MQNNVAATREGKILLQEIEHTRAMALCFRNARKIVLLALLSAFAVTFCYYLYLWSSYYKTLPRSPDMATGNVYADNFHGFVLYETRRQYFRLHVLERSGEALALIIIVTGALTGLDRRRGRSASGHARDEVKRSK